MSEKVLQGWKQIASAIGRDEKTARSYADEAIDPLPAYEYLGAIIVVESALQEWLKRQARPYRVRLKSRKKSKDRKK